MRRLAPLVFVLLLVAILVPFPVVAPTSGIHPDVGIGAGHVHAAPADQALIPCFPSGLPLGAVAPAPAPMWCYDALNRGGSTFVSGTNSWVDAFDHHLSLADLGPGYRAFEQPGDGESIVTAKHWRHNDHWMVDVRGRDRPGDDPRFGGTMMRPDRSFRFEDGRLVVEADVAAGIDEYAGQAWPELVVSTAPAPSARAADYGYGLGQFQGAWTVGCRLQERGPICALFGPRGVDDRIWEVASHLSAGAQIYGGGPFAPELDRAWRVCRGTDPDTNCRDRFRMELTRDSLTLYVNGVRYFAATGFGPGSRMDALVDAPQIYVYSASWIYRPAIDTVRFHWDRLAVNPGTPPSAAPGFGGAPASTPTPTPVATPTSTPIPPPLASCNPRPRISVSVVRVGPGRFQVTVTAPGSTDRLQALRFLSTRNARVTVGDRTDATGSFQISLTNQPQQTSFTVQRITPGAALFVPFVVADDCGEWRTFVGSGSNTL